MGWFEDNAGALQEAGISRDQVEDFLRRNPGDEGRAIGALTNNTGSRSFDSQSDNFDQKTNQLSAKGLAAAQAKGANVAANNASTLRWRYVPGTGGAGGQAISLLGQGHAPDPNIAASATPEDVEAFGTYADVAARIRQMYGQFLGRTPSNDEILGHIRNIPQRSYGSGDWEHRLKTAFMQSPEYQQSQPQKVVEIYKKWLGREPTNEEIRGHAANPHGLVGIEHSLANSPEYTQRIASAFGPDGQLKPGWTRTATGYAYSPGGGGKWERITGGTGTPGGGGGAGGPGGGGGAGPTFDPTTGSWFMDSDMMPTIDPFTEQFQPGQVQRKTYAQWMQEFKPPALPEYRPWNRAFKPPTEEDMKQDPGYKWRIDEGRRQLEAAAAAQGVLGTGGTLNSLMQLGQDYGSQEYGNVYNRRFGEYGMDFNTFDSDRQFELGRALQDFNTALQTYSTNYGTFAGERGFQQGVNEGDYLKDWNEYMGRFQIDRANQSDFYDSNRQNWMDLWNTSMQDRQQSELERTNQFSMLNQLTTDYYNRMFRMADYGYGAAGNIASLGNGISDYYTQMGNALASGRIGSANAWNTGLSNTGNNLLLSQFMRRSGYGTRR